MRLGCLASLAIACQLFAGEATQDLLRVDPVPTIRELSQLGSRMSGYPGCDKAANFIVQTFQGIGLSNITVEDIPVTVPVDRGAYLEAAGIKITLHGVYPNYCRTPKFPASGLEGKVIYGGKGALSDFNDKDVDGSIVLMEFDCSTLWLNGGMLGARAIVFIEPDVAARSDANAKFLDIPLPLPRFWIGKAELLRLASQIFGQKLRSIEEARKLLRGLGIEKSVTARLHADMVWQQQRTSIISGSLPGSDPELSKEKIIVEAYYDSTSVVPALSPGAENACSIAALIEAAKFLALHPPRRTVEFLAMGGHFQALESARYWAHRNIFLKDANPARLFVGIDISSRSNELGVFYKGHFYDQYGQDEVRLQRKYSAICDRVLGYATDSQTLLGQEIRTSFVSGIEPKRGRDWRSFLPDAIALDIEPIAIAGMPAIAFVTTGDDRPLVDTPLDVVTRKISADERESGTSTRSAATEAEVLNTRNVREETLLLVAILKRLVDDKDFPDVTEPLEKGLGSNFLRVVEESLIASLPARPLPEALVGYTLSDQKSLMGVRGRAYVIADNDGLVEINGINGLVPWWKTYQASAFQIDPKDGTIIYGMGPKSVRVEQKKREDDWLVRRTDDRLSLIPCSCFVLYDLLDQLTFESLKNMMVLKARTNAEPRGGDLGIYLGSVRGSYSEPCAVIFVRKDESIKVTMSMGLVGVRFVLLNVPEIEKLRFDIEREREKAWGVGYAPEGRDTIVQFTTYYGAVDMWRLDDVRLKQLTRAGIANRRLNEFHSLAKESLDSAEGFRKSRQYDKFISAARNGMALEAKAYPQVKSTTEDVVKGVIFYFALLLPFVFFAERLFLGLADLRKRIAAIAGIFLLIYLVMRYIHPAFGLSSAPIIILVGFFMLSLAGIIIMLLLGKFNAQMERLRTKTRTIHRADVSRGSAALTAFLLGISNMRKRKMRTTLTCITLILLTFTIVSFTSFQTATKINKIPTRYKASYAGTLLRQRDWSPLEEFAFFIIRDHFQQHGATVVSRSWKVSMKPNENLQIDVRRADNPLKAYSATSLLGVEPEEAELTHPQDHLLYGEPVPGQPGKFKWFDRETPGYPFVCMIPDRMAEHLGITQENYQKVSLTISGETFRIGGVLNSETFYKLKDLDNEPLTPVDYVQMEQRQQQGEGGGGVRLLENREIQGLRMGKEELLPELYIHHEPGTVVVVPNDFNVKHGGSYRSVAIGWADPSRIVAPPGAAEEAAEEGEGKKEQYGELKRLLSAFVTRLDLIIFAGFPADADRQVYLYSSRGSLAIGGIKGLLIPMAIAAMIVFNTMLGSVYERSREISVYASVGLAPLHIGSLFLAESCVYATMGAVIGYLLGQGVAKAMLELNWLGTLSLNYSSTAAVWTTLVVVAVVLISTAYPAHKAAQLSVPDETRKMKLPKPEGDLWVFEFPFTVSNVDAMGVNVFLYDYFKAHDEDSIGKFCADQVKLSSCATIGGPGYVLDALVWVAPLDMGISQRVKIETLPDPGDNRIYFLKFSIQRVSGEVDTWRRINGGFLKDVRKQLLIWRLVDPEEKKALLERAKTLFVEATA